MMNELKQYLNKEYNIHRHWKNALTDQDIISDYLSYFIISYIALNLWSIVGQEIELQKSFNKWLNNTSDIPNKIILETDFSFLKSVELQHEEHHITTEIVYAAEHIVNIILKKILNFI